MSLPHNNERLVLYADDDVDDRMLLVDTLKKVAPEYTIATVANGIEALDYLRKSQDTPPCLLILDLNMPGMNGKEVMQQVKADLSFKNLPIVVFTTSSNPADARYCARYGVDMITKPIDFDDFTRAANKLIAYCQM